MGFGLEVGSEGLRKEVVDSMVKQTAARTYKFKQAVAIVPTSAWTNTFFREDLEVSSGPTGNKFKGIPRGANFPHGSTKWEKISVRIVKYGSEVNIPWEDILSNDINVQARNIVRRTEEVVKSVDDTIWNELTEDRLGTGVVQSFAIGITGKGVKSCVIRNKVRINTEKELKTLIIEKDDVLLAINKIETHYTHFDKFIIGWHTTLPAGKPETDEPNLQLLENFIKKFQPVGKTKLFKETSWSNYYTFQNLLDSLIKKGRIKIEDEGDDAPRGAYRPTKEKYVVSS